MRLAFAWAVSSVKRFEVSHWNCSVKPVLCSPYLFCDGVEDVLPRDHLQAVADIEDRLAAGQAGERGGHLLEGVDAEREVVVGRLRVGAGVALGLGDALRFLDVAQRVPALGVGRDRLGRDLLQVEHAGGDQRRVAGEAVAHVQLAVVGDEHHLVVALQLLVDEGAQLAHHPVAVERVEVVVVDVNDQAQALVLGDGLGRGRRDRLRRGSCGGRGSRRRCVVPRVGLTVLDGEEVGHGDRPVVLVQLEVVLRQAVDAVALLVGHVDVDVDDVDVDRVHEQVFSTARSGLRGGLGGGGGGRRPAQQAQQRGNGEPLQGRRNPSRCLHWLTHLRDYTGRLTA